MKPREKSPCPRKPLAKRYTVESEIPKAVVR